MQWEYGRLTKFDNPYSSPQESLGFFSGDKQVNLDGNNPLEVLNRLGQDGWELVTVETGGSQSSSFRSFWLKRPLSNR